MPARTVRHFRPISAIVSAALVGCTSTYSVATLEVRRNQAELLRDGEAEMIDRSGDALTLTLDDETRWGDTVARLLRGCTDEPVVRWRPGARPGTTSDSPCPIDRAETLTIERTDVFTTALGIAVAAGIAGTLIACTAACESDALQIASGISLFVIPLAALPFAFLGGGGAGASANAFGTVR